MPGLRQRGDRQQAPPSRPRSREQISGSDTWSSQPARADPGPSVWSSQSSRNAGARYADTQNSEMADSAHRRNDRGRSRRAMGRQHGQNHRRSAETQHGPDERSSDDDYGEGHSGGGFRR